MLKSLKIIAGRSARAGLFLPAMLMMAAATSSLSAAQAMSPVGKSCYERAATNAQMLACAGAEYRRQGTMLARMIGRVKEELADDKRRVPAFDLALRRWQEWRDAECAARADLVRGGSAAPVNRLQCLAGLTERQTRLLMESIE